MKSPLQYAADNEVKHQDAWDVDELKEYGKLRPSMFMPRWASRKELEIVSVRVERLQDISEEDAKAEGIAPAFDGKRWKMYDHKDGEEQLQYVGPGTTSNPVESFRSLWLSLYGPGAWEANPWVWVVGFERG